MFGSFWGGFAATIGCRNLLETCELLVVRLSSGKVWRIDYPSGYTQAIQRLVRLD